jgi:hypothetical protein
VSEAEGYRIQDGGDSTAHPIVNVYYKGEGIAMFTGSTRREDAELFVRARSDPRRLGMGDVQPQGKGSSRQELSDRMEPHREKLREIARRPRQGSDPWADEQPEAEGEDRLRVLEDGLRRFCADVRLLFGFGSMPGATRSSLKAALDRAEALLREESR